MPSAQFRVGTTWIGALGHRRRPGARRGRRWGCWAGSAARPPGSPRSPRAARPSTGSRSGRPGRSGTRRTRGRGRRRRSGAAASPSDGATAITPNGIRIDGSASARARRARARGRRPTGRGRPTDQRGRRAATPMNACAFASRTSWAWPSRFSTVIRDSVPMAEAVRDDGVGPLVVDVDLDHVLVARDQHRVADATRGAPGSPGRRGRGRASGAEQVHGLVAVAVSSSAPGDAARRCARPGVRAAPARRRRSTAARPRAAASAPWNRRNRPWPPESTTCASRRIGSSDGVFATARSAASTVAASTASRSLSRSASATAAAAASRMTVRIVPSTGRATAL